MATFLCYTIEGEGTTIVGIPEGTFEIVEDSTEVDGSGDTTVQIRLRRVPTIVIDSLSELQKGAMANMKRRLSERAAEDEDGH